MTVLEDGIFAGLRKRHIFLNDSSFVSITCPKYHLTREQDNMHWFCHKEGVAGGPPHVVVDGSQNTAWTTYDYDDSILELNYIIFDFRKARTYVDSFGLQTICCSPQIAVLEGSNNYGSTWHQVEKVETPFEEYSTRKIKCSNPNFYSMYRFSQIGKCKYSNGQESNRFHIWNLEFYGKILEQHCTHIQRAFSSTRFIFAFFILYVNK